MISVADDRLPRHLINVDEYYRMAEVGLLAPDARVELISGEIIDTSPIGAKHASVVTTLARLLISAAGGNAIVRVQQPVRLNQRSELQPDLALLKPREDSYSKAHPAPPDTLLLIEVSDSSLRYDREIKLPLYAAHAIPEVWLIDLENRQLHCFRRPVEQRYAEIATFDGGLVTPSLLPGATIDLSIVLKLLA